jgi:hypothetical protein
MEAATLFIKVAVSAQVEQRRSGLAMERALGEVSFGGCIIYGAISATTLAHLATL